MPGTKVAGMDDTQVEDGVYSRRFLRFYDVLVYRVNLPFLWRCPPARLLDLYAENVSTNHLEVGVGTGYLLDRSRFPAEDPRITLMDLNTGPLEFTASRLERYAPQVHQASVLSPWKLPPRSFGSVAMSNLLHCVPGTLREKSAVAFEQASSALAPGGTLFGSTVLGEDADHTRRSRSTIRRLNRKGVFHNLEDRLEDLDAELGRAFASHELEVSGVMALFVAHTES
jgi:SAM-dependent methyltransferase